MTRQMTVQAIETKFLGPTNKRGSRIKASADAGSLTVAYDTGESDYDNHFEAAAALGDQFGWFEHGELLVAGGVGNGYVWVILTPSEVDRLHAIVKRRTR